MRIAAIAFAEPARTPAVTSLWPLRYFVALCMTISTPSVDRLLIDGAGEGVVDHRGHAARAAGPAIAAISRQRSVGLIGDSNHNSRVSGERTASGVRSSSSDDEPRADAELGQQIGEQVKRAAVDRRTADDLVAGFREREQRRRRRRLPARHQQRALRAFERRNPALDLGNGRVRIARIQDTSAIGPRCSRELPAHSRTGTSSSRRSAWSTARHCRSAPLPEHESLSLLAHSADCDWRLAIVDSNYRLDNDTISAGRLSSRSPLAATTGSMNWR